MESNNQEEQRLITGKSNVLIVLAIGAAVFASLAVWKLRPGDLGGGASTEKMGEAICSKL